MYTIASATRDLFFIMKYAFQTAFVTLVLNVAASEGASFDRHNRTPFVGKR